MTIPPAIRCRLFPTGPGKRPRVKFCPWVASFVVNRHSEGWSDVEIARALGVWRETVTRWRTQEIDLPSHPKAGRPPRDGHPEVRRLHALNLPDSHIAARLKIDRSTVQYWRKRMGLPANRRPGDCSKMKQGEANDA